MMEMMGMNSELCMEHSGHACRIGELERDMASVSKKVDWILMALAGIATEIPVLAGVLI